MARKIAPDVLADEPGDWAIHCHKSHHTMNAMGHQVDTLIGVDHRGLAARINKVIPDYMAMGERGMADMAEMEMPLPENTVPMMTGQGPHGSLEMGGMFSVIKVRKDQKPGDYSDPGWYAAPAGTVARSVAAPAAAPAAPAAAVPTSEPLRVRKPDGHGHHGH